MDDVNLPEQLSSLDKFKRRLEQWGRSLSGSKSTLLPPKDFKVNKSWADDPPDLSANYRFGVNRKANLLLWRLFLGASLFFAATIAVAVYVLFFSASVVSGNNIDLLIKGPSQIRSGDELNLQISLINRNKVVLNNASLVVSYPPGTMDPLAQNEELLVWREKLNDLNPGQIVDIGSRAIVFGGQNTTKDIRIVLEYRIPDSNALFTKEKIYPVMIGSPSLDLKLSLPTEINIGREFSGTLRIVSNAKSLLRNSVVRFDWPAGFEFQSANPLPVEGFHTWFLGDLVPGMVKEIKFTGTLSGQSGDLKAFKVSAGFAPDDNRRQITLEYGEVFQTIKIRKDFISAGIYLADESGRDPAIFPGRNLSGNLSWINNLDSQIINSTLELELSGNLIDKRTIRSSYGFYNSINNTIFWDERTLPSLKAISPDEGGQVSFGFNLLSLPENFGSLDKEIKLKFTFRGVRLFGQNQTEDVITYSEKTARISSPIKLTARSSYHLGPFKNIGSLPPKVGKETTYTINFNFANTLNDLDDVVVKTILPPSIKWQNLIQPLDEKIVYQSSNGEVVWNLGAVKAGQSGTPSQREVSFQVSFLPSLSQVGKLFNLTGPIAVTGKDLFSGVIVNQTISPVSTLLTDDPSFIKGQEIVVE